MKPIAYLVCSEDCGEPLTLVRPGKRSHKDVPKEGVLMYDTREATIFATRQQASGAIRRTKRHFVEKAKLTGRPSMLAEEKLYVRNLFPA